MKNTNYSVPPITIVIIEDHAIFCDGLVKLFEVEGGFQILDRAINGEQGLEAILTHQPQIVILDKSLPDGDGLQIARQIKQQNKATSIIILTGAEAEKDLMINILQAGASAYCHKSISFDELIHVVRKVHAGYYYIEGNIMCQAQAKTWLNKQTNLLLKPYVRDAHHRNITLSPRERDILKSVVQGKSNKEISQHLHISQQTVKNHMTSILNKLGVRDRTQAVITAIRHGWFNINDEFIDL